MIARCAPGPPKKPYGKNPATAAGAQLAARSAWSSSEAAHRSATSSAPRTATRRVARTKCRRMFCDARAWTLRRGCDSSRAGSSPTGATEGAAGGTAAGEIMARNYLHDGYTQSFLSRAAGASPGAPPARSGRRRSGATFSRRTVFQPQSLRLAFRAEGRKVRRCPGAGFPPPPNPEVGLFKSAIKSLLGSRHKREAKKLQPLVEEINEIYEGLASLSDEELRAKTDEFRGRIQEATAELKERIEGLKDQKRHSQDPGERERLSLEISGLEKELLDVIEDTLDDILPEAFAVLKDACRRLVGTEVTVTGQKLTWDMVPYDV